MRHRFFRPGATIWVAALAFVMLAVPGEAAAAEQQVKNSVFLEGFGPAVGYSFNYERVVFEDFAVRAGIGYLPMLHGCVLIVGGDLKPTPEPGAFGVWSYNAVLGVPITASYLGLRAGSNALEIGLGAVLVDAVGGTSLCDNAPSRIFVWGTAMVGYRFQPVDGGFQFRIGFSPMVGNALNFNGLPRQVGIAPWGYLSLGWAFGR